jgi:O-antigen ligase
VFLALAWTLPFLQWQHKPPIPSFYSEWLAFALGLLALLPLLSKRYWRPLVLPRSLLFLLGFIAVLVMQVVLDRVLYPQQALVGALYILWAAFLMWLGNQLGRELGLERIAAVLAWALLVGAVLSCAMGLLQHFAVHTPLDAWINRKVSNAVIANLGQPNHLANYLALGLASLLYLMAHAKLARWVGLPLGILLLTVLALTGARTSWLYLGAFSGLAWFWRKRCVEDAAARWIFPATLAMLPIFALAQWLAHVPFLQGVSGTITPADRLFDLANGIEVRLALWREAAQMLIENPWFGVGFGQFAWQHFQLASTAALSQPANALTPSLLAGSVFNHSHNLLAQIGAEFGLAGLLLLLVGGVLWLRACVRRPATLAGWWVAAVLAVIFLHSFLEYPLWYANFLGIAAVLIGAVDTHTLRLRLSGLLRAAFGVMLILSWIAGVRLLHTYRQLEGLLQDRQVKMSPRDIERVLQQVRQESLLAPYSDFAYALSIVLNRDAIDDKLELNALVMRFAPTQEIVYQQALLLGLQGQTQAAQMMLKRALVIYPAGASKFLQVLVSLPLENRNNLEPLHATAQVFLQEHKQYAFHTE